MYNCIEKTKHNSFTISYKLKEKYTEWKIAKEKEHN